MKEQDHFIPFVSFWDYFVLKTDRNFKIGLKVGLELRKGEKIVLKSQHFQLLEIDIYLIETYYI